MIDGKDAYEQIYVNPEHVQHTAITAPDGNMICHVIQQRDCNAPAMYQALMNHIFSLYLSQFMDVYLDDVIIYIDTLDDHVKHVKLVIDVLTHEKLYLSENKLHSLCLKLQILGRIVSDKGIWMDPYKLYFTLPRIIHMESMEGGWIPEIPDGIHGMGDGFHELGDGLHTFFKWIP